MADRTDLDKGSTPILQTKGTIRATKPFPKLSITLNNILQSGNKPIIVIISARLSKT